jgi:carbon starvation protein
MDVLLLVIVVFAGYMLMYRFYGRFIGRKIFKISPHAGTPAVEMEDGIDYVPTRKEIIFGHHFTSIAGTGPIVGPAIAIIWGWLPALLWVFLGSVAMGAVHDFGSLILSMRNQGKSISEITAKYINARTRIFFFIIVFLTLWIVIAIFGMIIAIIFDLYPSSVISVWLQIPIAVYLGHLLYRKGGRVYLWSTLAVIALYLTMIMGLFFPVTLPEIFGIPATGTWTIILLIYAYIASVLPVTRLLQPRDYINAYQLIIAMVLLTLGIIFSAVFGNLRLVAPVIQLEPAAASPMWPFLFITIACGAISGFHALVSSGTSAKQVKSESDSLFVGYGSMLVESALAVLVIAAVGAGIGLGYVTKNGGVLTGFQAWSTHYSSWTAAEGLGSMIRAFVNGAANMMEFAGIPHLLGVVIMGVFVSSFAGTTLDTATRIQRYVVSELAGDLKINFLQNRYLATGFVIITAAALAFTSGADGKGALTLWPMFGAVNQTLAALALIVITLYLQKSGGIKWLVSGIPALFMSAMTLWAALMNQSNFISAKILLLTIINAVIILLVIWIIMEGLIKFLKNVRHA